MSDPVDITIILNELGCTEDGSFVPVANEENKSLIAAIKELEERKEKKGIDLEAVKKKCENLRVHFDHANQEISQNLVSWQIICEIINGNYNFVFVNYLLEISKR